MNYYGYHRFTEDIDLWIAVSDENFDRLLQAIRFFFGEDLAGLDKAFLKQHDTLFLGNVPNKIEVIQKASGWISLRPILRTNKRASGRHKDLADLENLPES